MNGKKQMSNTTYSAFDTAAYFLSFKDRTVKELSDKLKEKGYDAEEIEEAISKMTDYGYLDDEKYAKMYFKANMNRKGISLIRRELFSKGIDKSVVHSILENGEVDLDSETKAVRGIYNRRFSDLDISDDRQKRKIYSYFQRRGFSFDVINRVLRDAGE
jgi:regulatory protein